MHRRAKDTPRRPRRRRLPWLAILAASPAARAAGPLRRRGPSLAVVADTGDACHRAARADGGTARRRRRDPSGPGGPAASLALEARAGPLAAGDGGCISRGGGGADAFSVASAVASALQHAAGAAGAALVLSGWFGAAAASRLVGWLDRRSAAAAPDPDPAPLSVLGRRTPIPSDLGSTLASTVGIAVMDGLGIGGGDAHARFADRSFVLSMWAYAELVDPHFAGAVGCAYAAITLVSSAMSSRGLIDLVSGIASFRLRGLGGDYPYVSEWDDRVSRAPVETSRRAGDAALASVANRLASGSLLLTFPQQCLGLYLLTGALVSWLSDRSVGGRAAKLLRWFGDGVRREGGASPSIDPRKLSSRLLAAHWAIFLAKMAFQLAFGIGVQEIWGVLTGQ